jgi:hypothetical protein
MKEEEWKETNWLDNIKPVKNLPFEDGVFNAYYRAILLRNVEFCKVVTDEDRVTCVNMTNKFIQKALNTAFYIHTNQVDVQDVLTNVDVEYDQEKLFYFLYIVYKELFRRDNPIASTVLTKVRLNEIEEPSKEVFYDFDCKNAWDYLLSNFHLEEFNKNMFSVMWFKYRKRLIKCKANKYEAFVYNLYLKDVKNKSDFTRRRPEKDEYTTRLQRAERGYIDKNIFDEV